MKGRMDVVMFWGGEGRVGEVDRLSGEVGKVR